MCSSIGMRSSRGQWCRQRQPPTRLDLGDTCGSDETFGVDKEKGSEFDLVSTSQTRSGATTLPRSESNKTPVAHHHLDCCDYFRRNNVDRNAHARDCYPFVETHLAHLPFSYCFFLFQHAETLGQSKHSSLCSCRIHLQYSVWCTVAIGSSEPMRCMFPQEHFLSLPVGLSIERTVH